MKLSIILFLLIFLCTQISVSVDFNQKFLQRIKVNEAEFLYNHPDKIKPVFLVSDSDSDIVINCYFSEKLKKFVFRTKLRFNQEKLLKNNIFKNPVSRFNTSYETGNIFYTQGNCHKLELFNNKIQVRYVPYIVSGMENDGFICDLGYLEIIVEKEFILNRKTFSLTLELILNEIFNGVKIKKKVSLNRYFYNKKSIYGFVHEYQGNTISESSDFLFYPVHKMTIAKNMRDNAKKAIKDRRFVMKFLEFDGILLSQDERAKQFMVHEYVKLRRKNIENSDIGSGQNNFVFLGYGPGINYFDDPFRKKRMNIPCPRFIFGKDIIFYSRTQFYPDYSIGTYELGVGRLNEYNRFQKFLLRRKSSLCLKKEFTNQPVFMCTKNRKKYIETLENKLLEYGILNDDDRMELGFEFNGEKYIGNIVNNEIRILDTIKPTISTLGVIIPAGLKNTYLIDYEKKIIAESASVFINGIFFKDYFIDSVNQTDLGMRQAYLEFVIRNSSKLLYSIIKRARKSKRSYGILLRLISRMIGNGKKEYIKNCRNLRYRILSCREKYFDYLQSVRNRDIKKMKEKLKTYVDNYKKVFETEIPQIYLQLEVKNSLRVIKEN